MKIQNMPTGAQPEFLKPYNPHFRNEMLMEQIKQDNGAALIYLVRKFSLNVNKPISTAGKTLLGLSVELGADCSVRALLNEKADPNLPDAFGKTPLFYLLAQDVPNDEPVYQQGESDRLFITSIQTKPQVLNKMLHDLLAAGAQIKTAGLNRSSLLDTLPIQQGVVSTGIRFFMNQQIQQR